MEQPVPLQELYGHLLGELCARLGAQESVLLLGAQDGQTPRPVARAAPEPAPAPAATWLELPIYQGAACAGALRLAFGPSTPLPELVGHSNAHPLVKLAALLAQQGQTLTWAPSRTAGQRMLAVSEEELQRIILDIHDGPVQKLFAVSSHLALLQARLADYAPELRADLGPPLGRIEGLVQSALQEIKSSISIFRPAEFQRRPLPSVLQGLAMQHEALTGNQVDLTIDGRIPQVGLPVKIALYRVLQEALANAHRHAGVDRHRVRLSRRGDWVELEVADEGRGFTPPPLEGPGATEREEHIGLRGMRERMHLVGGQFRVISRPGGGTRVIVRVACHE